MTAQYGLIFDVDGVIADTEAVNAEASIQVFADLFGIQDVRRADFEEGLGRGAEEYILAAARIHGFDPTPEQIIAATAARQEVFLQLLAKNPLPPFPGVRELMDAALAREDTRVAIATSSTREKSEAVLRSAEIPYHRMAYVTGSDVTRKKPDPELFLLAARGIDVAPEACVVIEDAPNGVQAARAAGCKCIAVTNTCPRAKLEQAKPNKIVDSLAEVNLDTVLKMLGA